MRCTLLTLFARPIRPLRPRQTHNLPSLATLRSQLQHESQWPLLQAQQCWLLKLRMCCSCPRPVPCRPLPHCRYKRMQPAPAAFSPPSAPRWALWAAFASPHGRVPPRCSAQAGRWRRPAWRPFVALRAPAYRTRRPPGAAVPTLAAARTGADAARPQRRHRRRRASNDP